MITRDEVTTVPVCTTDPKRWETSDPDAKKLCQGCPIRSYCAREAWETPDSSGIWAGIAIPESQRGRTFAMGQLKSLAEQGGLSVRPSVRRYRSTQITLFDNAVKRSATA